MIEKPQFDLFEDEEDYEQKVKAKKLKDGAFHLPSSPKTKLGRQISLIKNTGSAKVLPNIMGSPKN
jgi:hypothetical protein